MASTGVEPVELNSFPEREIVAFLFFDGFGFFWFTGAQVVAGVVRQVLLTYFRC